MRQVFGPSGPSAEAGRERAPHSEVLVNKLLQRRLQMMAIGIPDNTYEAGILVTDPRTGQSHGETWEFHGSSLTSMNIVGADPRDSVHLEVILGIHGELLALHAPTSDHQQMRCTEVSDTQLAEHTGIAMRVLAGFDRLLAAGGPAEQPMESAALPEDLPPNVIWLDSYRSEDEPPDDTSA